MASVREEIAKNVKEINDNQKKHFGTKLPSNANKEEERTLEELAYEQMIMASLASLAWGVKSKDTATKVKELLNKPSIYNLIESIRNSVDHVLKSSAQYINKNDKSVNVTIKNSNNDLSIIDKLASIKESIDSLYLPLSSLSPQQSSNKIDFEPLLNYLTDANFVDFFLKTSNNGFFTQTNEIIEILKKLKKDNNNTVQVGTLYKILHHYLESIQQGISNIKSSNEIRLHFSGEGFKDLNSFIDSLNNLKVDKDNNLAALNQFSNVINTILSISFEKNIKDAEDSLQELINFVFGNEKSIGDLYKNISKIFSDNKDIKSVETDISQFSSVLDTLITAISIDPKTINDKGLRMLIKITKPDPKPSDVSIKNLLDNLSEITKGDLEIEYKKLAGLQSFFEAMSTLGEIGLIKRMKMRSNLKYFAKHLKTSLPELMNILVKASKNVQNKESLEALQSIGKFFESLINIANITKEQRRNISRNLAYISEYIIDDLTDPKDGIIPKIIKALKKSTKDSDKVLKSLSDFFTNIFNAANFTFIDLIKLNIKLDYLNNEIIDELIFNGEDSLFKMLERIDTSTSRQKIKDITEVFDLVQSLNEYIPGFKTMLMIELKLNELNNTVMPLLQGLLDNIKKINEAPDLSTINNIIANVGVTTTDINQMPLVKLDSITSLIKFNVLIFLLEKFGKYWIKSKKTFESNDLTEFFNSLENNVLNPLITLKNTLDIVKFTDADNKKVKNILSIINSLSTIGKLSITVKVSEFGMNTLLNTANKIKEIIDVFNTVKQNDAKKATTIIKSFMTIVALSGALMLFGAMIMNKVRIVDLIAFTVCLSTFLFTLSFIFKGLSKLLKESIANARNAAEFVLMSSVILILGATLIKYVDPNALIAFTVMLSGFLFALVGIFSKGFKESLNGAKDAAYLITVAGGILLLGGVIMHLIDPVDLIIFGATLATFIGAIALIFVGYTKFAEEAIKGVKEAAILIAYAGGALILGGLFMRFINVGDLVVFAVTLAAFVGGLVFIFSQAEKGIKRSMAAAMGLAYLVGISGTILLAGAAILKTWPDLYVHVIAFGVILWGFIALLTSALDNKKIRSSIPTAIALGVLVAISAAVLLIGGYFIKEGGPELVLSVAVFGVLLFGFIWLMSKAMGMLAKNAKNLVVGIILTALLGAVVYGLTYVFGQIDELSKSIDWIPFLSTLGIMTVVIAGLLWICTLIGGNPVLPEIIAIGELVLAGIAGVIWLFGKAMQEIAGAMDAIAKASQVKIDFDNIVEMIKSIGVISLSLVPLGTVTPIILSAALAMTGMKKFIGDAADIMYKWSSLSVPLYDEQGKLIGQRSLSNEDLSNAAVNIYNVVNTLFNTVRKIYDDSPDMFDFSISSIFSGGSKFSKVARSGQALGKMLSTMVDAIKEWSDLKIPIYEGTKITGYKTIDNKAFVTAAENINKVVVTLARAVISTYYTQVKVGGKTIGGKELFDAQGFLGLGDTPFARVVKSIKPMGDMLINLAKGIQAWAKLKIPIYKPNSTEIDTYLDLSKEDAFKNVGKNIAKVVTALGVAIIKVYKEAPEGMFNSASWLGFGDSVFAKVVKSIKPMGDMLINLAKGIQSWADMKIPTYGEDGNVNGYISLDNSKLKDAGDHIASVVTALGKSIVDVYNSPNGEKLFKDDKVLKAITTSINNVAKTLATVSSVVKQYAEGKFPTLEWKDGKLNTVTGDFVLNDKTITSMKKNVAAVVMALAGALYSVYYTKIKVGDNVISGKELFEETGLFSKKDAPAIVISKSIKIMATTLTTVIDCIKNLQKSDLNNLVAELPSIKDNLTDILKNTLAMFALFTEKGKWEFIAGGVSFSDEISLVKWLKKQDSDISDSKKYIENYSKYLINIIEAISKISETYAKYEGQLSKLAEAETNNSIYKAVASCINAIYSSISNIELNNDNEIKKFTDHISLFIQIINKIYDAEKFNSTVRTLRDGMLSIYATSKQIEQNDIFGQHVEQLDKYVNTINSVDLRNLSQMQRFVDSMNLLSSRLGSLDKLTDAIASKLSVVLYELVNQLMKADASIKNAHELQNKRKTLIEDATKKIEQLMNKHMIVEISQSTDDGSNNKVTINGVTPGTNDTNQSTHEDNITVNDYTREESPENATANVGKSTEGTGSKSSGNNSKALTFLQFKTYMENNFNLNKS